MQFAFSVGFQISIFLLIRLLVMALFKDNAGVDGVIRLSENLRMYTYYPLLTFLHWALFVLLLWRIIMNWNRTPEILRLSFSLLFPVLMVVYLVAGFSFEVRVFAEVYPITTVILWMPKETIINSQQAILER